MDRKTLSVTGLVALLTLAGCNESGRPLSDGTAGPAFNGQAPIMGVEQGNTYVVAAGDTVATIADRTHTPVRTLIDLNNLQPPYVLKSGQRLALQAGANTGNTNVAMGQSMVIPEASSNGAAAPSVAPSGGVTKAALPPLTPAKPAQAATATTQQATATATQAPQVLQSSAQQSKTIATQSMSAANTATQNTVGAANATAAQAANQAGSAANKATAAANNTATNAVNKAATLPNGEPTVSIPDFPDATAKTNAAANAASNAASNAANSAASQVAAVTPAPAAATGSGQFGWPVQGKVVSKFGATADGLRNDGINIAAPAGAPVVAAADGVVAYAGNELRGFGNMILIRHADGWVTAYAHNESLAVKKGDTVKRGQTIARVGQTGNVTSPQLHFEIRKGTSAQDPTKYLGS